MAALATPLELPAVAEASIPTPGEGEADPAEMVEKLNGRRFKLSEPGPDQRVRSITVTFEAIADVGLVARFGSSACALQVFVVKQVGPQLRVGGVLEWTDSAGRSSLQAYLAHGSGEDEMVPPWLKQLLDEHPALQIRGSRLNMAGDTTSVLLEEVVPGAADPSLPGLWLIVSGEDHEPSVAVVDGVDEPVGGYSGDLSLTFSASGLWQLSAVDCALASGAWFEDGDRLIVEARPTASAGGCSHIVTGVSEAYGAPFGQLVTDSLHVLSSKEALLYKLTGNRLMLERSGRRIRAVALERGAVQMNECRRARGVVTPPADSRVMEGDP